MYDCLNYERLSLFHLNILLQSCGSLLDSGIGILDRRAWLSRILGLFRGKVKTMGPADFLWRFQVFFDVLADTSMHEELAIRELAHCLDRLIVFHHFYDAMPDPGSVEDAVIPFDDAAVQALVRARFPSLGLYNIPRAIVTDIGTTSLGVCRAHDDLLAIAHGLGAIRWYGERGDFDTATWYYLFGMQSDLGNRIHNLRWYLHARVNER